MTYDLIQYMPVIPPYSGLKLYDSLSHKTDNFLSPYVTEKDLSKIDKFLDTGKYKPNSDVIDALFTDKVDATKFLILHLISQIREREIIKERNLESIDYDMGKFRTHLMQLEEIRLYHEIFDLERRRTKISLGEKIAGLEKEKRAEETSCWRDLTQLRKELMDSIKEYKTSSRKKELIVSPQVCSLEAKIKNDK